MNANALANTHVEPRLLQDQSQMLDSSRSPFEDLMRISTDRIDLAGKTKQKQVEQLTNQFVSVAFIQPMMAQLRDSPFKSEMFSNGSGGDMFQQHLDTILADRISQRANLPIARVMYERINGVATPAVRTDGVSALDDKAADHRTVGDESAKSLQGIDTDG